MDIEVVILSELSQIQKEKYHITSHKWNLKKKGTNELIYKTDIQNSYDQPRQHIKKQRHYLANRGPSS